MRFARTRLFALLFAIFAVAELQADEPKPPEFTAEEKKLDADASMLNREAIQLFRRGQASKAVEIASKALEIRRKQFPVSRFPDGHPNLVVILANMGAFMNAANSADKALTYYEQAHSMAEKLYPASRYPQGHAVLAGTTNGMGFILKEKGSFESAVQYFDQALKMRQRLYPATSFPDGNPELAESLNNMGFVLNAMGKPRSALPYYEQSLSMKRKLFSKSKFPNGHPDLASSLSNLGYLLQELGSIEESVVYHEQALAMRQDLFPASQYPNGHPYLAISLSNLGGVWQKMGQLDRALPFYEQALAMREKLFPAANYPHGQRDLATSLNNLGLILSELGQYEKALPLHEKALAMRRLLFPESSYPNGHPELASSLSNLGSLLKVLGFFEKGLTYCKEALAMTHARYSPTEYRDGHPELAICLGNMGSMLIALDSHEKALPFIEKSLAMWDNLYPESKYPNGHPFRAVGLNQLGLLLHDLGAYDKALLRFDQALDMFGKLYSASKFPDGHHSLAVTIINKARLMHAMGSYKKAMPIYQLALAMRQKLGRRVLMIASESEALTFAETEPLTEDAFLSVTSHMPDANASAYESVWVRKSAVTRMMEMRNSAARLAGTVHAKDFEELRIARSYLAYLLRDTSLSIDERDKLLLKATDKLDRLERKLAMDIPFLARAKELGALGPNALRFGLTQNSVFVDFVRYIRFEYDLTKPGRAGETRTTHYTAFVIVKPPRTDSAGSTIARIELGNAAPIDSAVTTWRAAIDQKRDDRGVASGDVAPVLKDPTGPRELLRKLVWQPLARHLPPGTKTIYIAPDGDLARIPWAVLPIAKDRVLLEDYEIAVVPHGPFLLEQLKFPRKYDGPNSALVLGDVEYKSKSWPELPGTKSEMNAIVALAPGERETASRGDATTDRVSKVLAKVRYAHLATHGFFDADGFAAEKKREDWAMKNRQFGDETRRVASKNPLGFVGLVLSNGEIMTGLSLVDLPLENLKLVTLSACETGLGELTAGEGVQGLARAFHVAGCPNVVASLWKVNDAATAALMAKFYHELWVNKQLPLAALRSAQLFIYYHPELILDLAGERGAPKRTEALAVKVGEPGALATGVRKRADTKLWAAFVLSGVGK